MEQLNFYNNITENGGLPPDILDYKQHVFNTTESRHLLDKLIADIPWQQKSVLMYGKTVVTPRLTAWFGNPDVDYSISGNQKPPFPWTKELLMVKDKVETLSGYVFNSVLLNYYRDANDSVGWHSDNDGSPGKNKIVASVSFGQERKFEIRKNKNHDQKFSILLEDGSYLLMKGNFQDEWQHRIPKSSKVLRPRVNLTFRIL